MADLTLGNDPENHGAAPPGHTLSPGKLRQGQWGSPWSPPQAVLVPDTRQGHSPPNDQLDHTAGASTARSLGGSALPF